MKMKKYLTIIFISVIIICVYTTNIKNNKYIPKPLAIHEPELLNSIIEIESSWNPKAISKKGCIGLMQINPRVWVKWLKAQGIIKTKNDLFIPEKNIEAGKFILAYYSYKTNHDIEKTLYLYSGKDKKYPKKILSKMR